MSDTSSAGANSPEPSQAEFFSGLFAQLVIQQTNMAMMLMGKVPHPETGKTIKDTDAARLFIDQLEMLEAKTKGNLTKEESGLLKQSLMTLRLTFVDAVNSESTTVRQSSSPAPAPHPAEPAPPTSKPGEPKADASSQEEEHRKKFSKKY